MTRTPSIVLALLLTGLPLSACRDHASRESGLFREGRRVFVSGGCGGCHTLASAHTHGRMGPDFDTSEQLSRSQIRRQLNLGLGGMPSFRGRLSRRQKDAVSEFVYVSMKRRR